MFKNYLKIALAVLLRRKFLTFVSLFGTVLTLTVLIVAYAIGNSIVHPAGAEHRHDHILAVNQVMLTHGFKMNTWISNPGGGFFTNYVKPLRTPDLVSLNTGADAHFTYLNGRKLTVQMRFTDAAYWQILDFRLRAGRLLAPDDIAAGRLVAVINEATAEIFFPGQAAVGKSIPVGSRSYEVVGVVRNEPQTSRLAYADVWAPLTAQESRAYEQEFLGGMQIILYVNDPAKREAMRQELAARVRRFEFNPDHTEFDSMKARATTPIEEIAAEALGRRQEGGDYTAQFLAIVAVAALLFMALPAINLVNLNVGRIMERAPEIGLRKAAGAPTRVLVGQFIFENLVLTLLGGVVAFMTVPFVLQLLNGVLRYYQLQLSLSVFIAALAFVMVFGVLSGAYPAWKMARLDPAAALKGQRHV